MQEDAPKVRVFSVAVSISTSAKKQTFLYGGSAIRLYFHRVFRSVLHEAHNFSHVIFLEDREFIKNKYVGFNH